MMSLNQKILALVVIVLIDLAFFVFSPLLGILAVVASSPLALAILGR